MHGRRRRGRGELKGSGPTRQWPEHLPSSWLIWAASFAQCKGSRRQWRQTGGRRITVRRPLLPRVIRWGLHRWYLTAAKRVLSPVQRMLQMWVRFPQSPPPSPPVALDRAFCRARCRRDPGSPTSLAWRCSELARDTRRYAYGIAPRRHGHVFAALHRSCAKVGRLKSGPFRDRSNADPHACVRV